MDTTELRITLTALDDVATELIKFSAALESANDTLGGRLDDLGASPENLSDLNCELRNKILRMTTDITRLEVVSDDSNDRKQITADGRVYDYLKQLLILVNEVEKQARQHEDDDIFAPTCATMEGIRKSVVNLRLKLMQFAFEYRPAIGGHFTASPDREEVRSFDPTISNKAASR